MIIESLKPLNTWCDSDYVGFVSASLYKDGDEYFVEWTDQNGGEVDSQTITDLEEVEYYMRKK